MFLAKSLQTTTCMQSQIRLAYKFQAAVAYVQCWKRCEMMFSMLILIFL